MMLTDLFYIVVFMSISSAVAWLAFLLVQSVGHIKLPYQLLFVLMVFFILPVKYLHLKLIDPDPSHVFLTQMEWGSKVWLSGMIVALLYHMVNMGILGRTIAKLEVCTNQRVSNMLVDCSRQLNLKLIPKLYYRELKEPACTTSFLRPVIILSKSTIDKLNDYELRIVLLHELMHIKRRHIILQRVLDLICCFHWFNPFAWIARYEFSLSCEVDCDQNVIKQLPEKGELGYVKTMLRLMELSFERQKNLPFSVGFMTFIRAKQRFNVLLAPVSNTRKAVAAIASILIICSAMWVSLTLSNSFFYPYSANKSFIERGNFHDNTN